MQRTKSVADYLNRQPQWARELERLRGILQKCGLDETIKWGAPCYTHNGKNVVGLVAFKDWVALWFHQGALLQDPERALINAQEGRTKAQRQWRFTNVREIKVRIVTAYVREAIALVESGREIKAERGKALTVPAELTQALRRQKGATAAFAALSKGKQREYADYISAAKKAETRQRRIEKVVPMIAAGDGLNDRYRRR